MACMETIQRRLTPDGRMMHEDGTPWTEEEYKGYCRVDPEYPNVTYFKQEDVSQHPAWQRVLNPSVSQELIDAYLDYDTDEDQELQDPQMNQIEYEGLPGTIIHQTDNIDFACRILRAQRERQEGVDSIKAYRPNFEGSGDFWTKRAEQFTGLRGPIAVRKFREMKQMKYKKLGKKMPDFDGQLSQETIQKQLDKWLPSDDMGKMEGVQSTVPYKSGKGGLGPAPDNLTRSAKPNAKAMQEAMQKKKAARAKAKAKS